MWFKILLMVWFCATAVAAIYKASKGKHEMEITPGAQALSAVISVLFVIGIWLLL